MHNLHNKYKDVRQIIFWIGLLSLDDLYILESNHSLLQQSGNASAIIIPSFFEYFEEIDSVICSIVCLLWEYYENSW